jgi:hypothetical protein
MEDFLKQHKKLNFLYDAICIVGFVLGLFMVTLKLLMFAK